MKVSENTGHKTSSNAVAHNLTEFSLSRHPVVDTIQTKLTIGQPGDKYELEADRVADQVMSMPESKTIQPRCDGCEEEDTLQMKTLSASVSPWIQTQTNEEEEPVQAKSDNHSSIDHAPGWIQTKINSSNGSGGRLPDTTRSFMENRFGADFSNVRIHNNANAAQLNRDLNAQAFTIGSDIYFNSGKYNPESMSGQHLLAHELTHVQQQNPRSVSSTGQKSIMREVRGMVAPTREGRVVNDEEWELVTSALEDAKNMVSATVDSLNGVHRLLFSRADPRAFTERQQFVAGLFRIHYKNPRPLDAFEAHENYGFILTALQSLGRNSFRVVSTQQAIDDPGRDTYAYVRGRDPTIYLSEIFFNDLLEIEPGEGSVTVGPPLLSPEQKARLLIHETAHFRLGVTHRGGVFGLDLVNCESGFSIRTANQGLQNAYVYDHFAYCVSQLVDSD